MLVAIAVPVFTSQLEKSREATDLANVRAVYAKILSSAISEDSSSDYYKSPGVFEAEVALVQTKDGWTTDVSNMSIGHVKSADWDKHDPLGNGSCKLIYANGKMNIDWGGENTGTNGIDPKNSYSVGSGILEYVLGQLSKSKNNEEVEEQYAKLFKSKTDATCNDNFVLPDGTIVQVTTYSRNYDSFEDIQNRINEKDKATLLYNRNGQISTIIYWNGTDWMCWQANKQDGNSASYESWKDESNWQKNKYTTYKKDANGVEWIQEWELKDGKAVCVKTTKK